MIPQTDIFAVIDATWPAERTDQLAPWTLRVAKDAGNRVSAATLEGPLGPGDLPRAETAMRGLGQPPLFMIRPGDGELDTELGARGYAIRDAVTIYACPVEHLTGLPLPRVTVFTIWPPLVIQREIWMQGGMGPGKLAVMERVGGSKTGLLARFNDKPGGAGFVAIHRDTAMLHGLEVLPDQRKRGLGGWMMRAAALWAAKQGARTMTVMCTDANTGANALYASLGMEVVGHYHYRFIPSEADQL